MLIAFKDIRGTFLGLVYNLGNASVVQFYLTSSSVNILTIGVPLCLVLTNFIVGYFYLTSRKANKK